MINLELRIAIAVPMRPDIEPELKDMVLDKGVLDEMVADPVRDAIERILSRAYNTQVTVGVAVREHRRQSSGRGANQ